MCASAIHVISNLSIPDQFFRKTNTTRLGVAVYLSLSFTIPLRIYMTIQQGPVTQLYRRNLKTLMSSNSVVSSKKAQYNKLLGQ